MSESVLCVSAEIYNDEALRLCKSYLAATDGIIPFEGELDGDIDTPCNRALLYQLKVLAKNMVEDKELFEKLRKRIYFLEVRGVARTDTPPEPEESSEDFKRAVSLYRFFEELLSYRTKPVYLLKISEELRARLDDVTFFECDTMVGALRAPRQFGVCLKRKFYHIPAKQVEEYPIPKYVAIYQSERLFGKEVSGIKYYGEVKKCIPIRRNRIRELPKSSTELYYKFKVKEWKRLENPIQARELGFVRLFTSHSLLQNAIEVPELTMQSKDDFILYRLMYLANKEIRENPRRIFTALEFLGFDVIFSLGAIYLCKEGKTVEKYPYSSFSATPTAFFQRIKKKIKEES